MSLPGFVCLSVSNAWTSIWVKYCVSANVGTWTNWLTFEPDPDYSPDAGTGLLSPISYKRWYRYAELYIGKIRRRQNPTYTVFQKKSCDHVFDDKLKWNCPFTKIFGTLITKSIGHRQVFLFSHLTYLVQLLYLGKLSRPKYQQKLIKIMKISQEDVILIKKSLSVKAVWCMKAVEWIVRQGLETWKHRQSAEEKPQDGYNCPASKQR